MTGTARRFPGEELVVVTSPLLVHKITRGYGDPFGLVVSDVDGIKIKNLRHLVEVLRDGKGEFVTIRFFGEYSQTLVFRRKAMELATAELMSENGIPRGARTSSWRSGTPGPRRSGDGARADRCG